MNGFLKLIKNRSNAHVASVTIGTKRKLPAMTNTKHFMFDYDGEGEKMIHVLYEHTIPKYGEEIFCVEEVHCGDEPILDKLTEKQLEQIESRCK